MDIFARLLTVLGLGAVELWAAIPAGFALGLHPIATAIASALGAITSALVVVLLGDRARAWILARHGFPRDGEGRGRTRRIWDRYGVVGLGLLAPLLIGAPLGTALGLILDAPMRRLLLWVCFGIVLWSALLTAAWALGLAGFETLRD
jgi:membrane protein YqaA with SNARE-associated domain